MAALTPLVLNPPLNVTVIRDAAGLDLLRDFFSREKEPGWDIETNPLKDYFYRKTRTIQFGNTKEQYVIDLLSFCDNDPAKLSDAQGYYGMNVPESLKPVLDCIRPVLASKDWLKVGVNLSFEYQNFYWQFGIRSWHFYDCAMVERCIWAGALGSMKQYAFFSMESMMERYFSVSIDKTLQTSFNTYDVLTDAQIDYAALDTRLPVGIKALQRLILKGHTPESLRKAGMGGAAKMLEEKDENGHPRLNPIIFGDSLEEIAQIENDAVGAFEDMHVHGERLDRERWLERVAKTKLALKDVIEKELDAIFLPIVGSKYDIISEQDVEDAKAKWKVFNIVAPEETELKKQIRQAKSDPDLQASLQNRLADLEAARKEKKEALKKQAGDLSKKRTKIKNLAAKCQGAALINYDSGAQLLGILKGLKGLKSIDDTDDETLEKYEHIPVMAALRKYRGLAKEVSTYGDAWAMQWVTKPCNEEGWLHPGDGRLHCVFNQYDAETGRSTSEKPNGQNLPKDKAVRSCFIADPPDESIRISVCCEADTHTTVACLNHGSDAPCDIQVTGYICDSCGMPCQTKAEEYVIVTADMSGAELRILAECADDPVWIGAFARGEDVHSVCTELIEDDKWHLLALPDCAYYLIHTEETVAKNSLRTLGDLQRQKCKCPEHNDLRDGMKPTNFGLPYGISERALAPQIKKSIEDTRKLMLKHKAKFPLIWEYIDRSGRSAKMNKKAFDMYGRRRLFVEPTWESAREKAKRDREEKLRIDDVLQQQSIANFIQMHGREPQGKLAEVGSEMYILTHRDPSRKEIGNAFKSMYGSMERQGKNHCIQGTNATVAKKAMGAGFDPEGKPYLWHTLPQYNAKLIKFVHDELVIQCPKRYGQKVAALIGDAFKRAAAEKMKKVVMEFDFNIATYWKK